MSAPKRRTTLEPSEVVSIVTELIGVGPEDKASIVSRIRTKLPARLEWERTRMQIDGKLANHKLRSLKRVDVHDLEAILDRLHGINGPSEGSGVKTSVTVDQQRNGCECVAVTPHGTIKRFVPVQPPEAEDPPTAPEGEPGQPS